MDTQLFQTLTIVFGILVSVIGFSVAWWVNNIWTMVKDQQHQLTALSLRLAEGYVPRQELQETFKQLFQKLDEIQRDLHRDRERG